MREWLCMVGIEWVDKLWCWSKEDCRGLARGLAQVVLEGEANGVMRGLTDVPVLACTTIPLTFAGSHAIHSMQQMLSRNACMCGLQCEARGIIHSVE